ncbi:class I SAM-dependent methyltransferase family protein [Dactylosporangium roseum]|uniref:Class I SAM-dependent methyltransferase family protein n=1 Tax=Dactylosporangium roseum TaxID=47989 RepID=A0ABY5YYC6_9ACTN|nr:class I SAM-dependent methyltransferase family protein [Dactylosporangium roseum]UWZ34749.1 class I SAM-dependent methyltransferase family protein [Dactylosporangium roseum]
MTASSDWHEWHLPYGEHGSPLSRRLRLIQQHISDWVDERPESTLRVVSVCAGQGHDLIGVLSQRPDADRVRAELIEHDPRNVAAARAGIASAGLEGITAIEADAGDFAAYRHAIPVDLVILAGVLGNLTDCDVQATINAMPALCAPRATVIWTRTRRAPDPHQPFATGSPTPASPRRHSTRRPTYCSRSACTSSTGNHSTRRSAAGSSHSSCSGQQCVASGEPIYSAGLSWTDVPPQWVA